MPVDQRPAAPRYSAIRSVHCEARVRRRPEGPRACWGVTAGPIDSSAALGDARAMLGRGTRESGGAPGRGAGEGTLGALVGLVGEPPPGLPALLRPPAARAPRPGQQPQHGQHPPAATASERELCWGGLSICWRAVPDEEKVTPSFSGGSADDYEAAAGSFLGGGVDARVAGASGILGLERIVATRRGHPEVVVGANDRVTREALGLLPGESLSVQRHARELLIPQVGNFSTLKRMAIMIAGALDEGRQRGSVHHHALLWHMYCVSESAAL